MQPVSFTLTIGVIKISMVENASAVNIGKNLLVDWDSHSKSNQGLGNISGDSNALEQLANHLEDPDGADFVNPASAGPPGHENLENQKDLEKLIDTFFKEEP